jgi:citrate lyase gamma subunit
VLERGRLTQSFQFRLPDGAIQGPEEWYTVHHNYILVLARDSGPGVVWVTASTNERTAAQIEYTVRRSRETLLVRESRVDLVNGAVTRVLRSRLSAVHFRNYLQYEGVRGGTNTIRFAVEASGRARVERLEVQPTSGVFRTSRSPYPLKIHPSMAKRPIQVGDTFAIELTLSRRTSERIADVKVRPVYDRGTFTLHGRPIRYRAQLDRPHQMLFEFKAREAGTHDLRFLVDSNRNRPSAVIRLLVGPRGSTSSGSIGGILWAVLFAPLAVGLGYLLWPRATEPT